MDVMEKLNKNINCKSRITSASLSLAVPIKEKGSLTLVYTCYVEPHFTPILQNLLLTAFFKNVLPVIESNQILNLSLLSIG